MSMKEIFWTKEFGRFVAATIDGAIKLTLIWFVCRACFKYVYGY